MPMSNTRSARLCSRAEILRAATEAFQNAVRLDPESREGYYALGLALKQQARIATQTAPECAQRAQMTHTSAHCKAAAQGNLKEAEQLLNESLAQR